MKAKKAGALFVFGIIALLMTTGYAQARGFLESSTVKAGKFYQKGEYDSAIVAAKKAIAKDPKNAGQAWYYLAISYKSQGKREDARDAFMRALGEENGFFDVSADVCHGRANYALGTMSYSDNEFDKAIDYFNKTLEFYSSDTNTLLFRGDTYLSKGLYREAINDFNIVLAKKKSAVAYEGMAYAYLGLGDAARAFPLLQKAEQASSTYNSTFDEASFYYALGEKEKLKDLFNRTGFLGVEYSELTGRKSKLQKAIKITQVVKDGPAEQAGLLPGDLIIKMNDKPVQGAQEFLQTVQNMVPGASVSLNIKRKREKKKISVVVGYSPRLTPAHIGKNLWIAALLRKKKTIDKAMLAEKNGELRNAFFIYSNYMRQAPLRPIEYEQDIIERLISLYRQLDPPPAIPEEAHRHAVKAAFYVKDASTDEDFLQANAEYEQTARTAPWWADIYFNYALAQQSAGDYKGAIDSLKLFLLAAPDDPAVNDVRNRIYTLEAQVDKYAGVKRWEGRWKYVTGVLKLKVKENKAKMVFIKVNKDSYNSGYHPGETKLIGSISNDEINGKLTISQMSGSPDVIRCFAKKREVEMHGQLSPDGQTINIQYTDGSRFNISTCALTEYEQRTVEFTRIP